MNGYNSLLLNNLNIVSNEIFELMVLWIFILIYFTPLFSYFRLLEFVLIAFNKKKNSLLLLKFLLLINSLVFFINSVFCVIKSFIVIIFCEYNDLKYILINNSSSSLLCLCFKKLLAKHTNIVFVLWTLYSNNML